MKIDIHVHTRKCKKGDAHTRNIEPERFAEIVSSTEVQILAITNHNVFDLDQFNQIEDVIDDHIQIWPGVELDIVENEVRSHLLVIVSPLNAQAFDSAVSEITANQDPDDFTATIKETLANFDQLGPLYVAHYKQKKPAMPESTIDLLIKGTARPARVIKEVQNAISAGIYISHGYPSIYGSDVSNWDKYEEIYSKTLPDLRLPVESFEHFCLLLEKDATTINTLLDQKISEELTLVPFEDDTEVSFKAYNDINVIFGSKGTGKSCILKAISRHYSNKGMDARRYKPATDKLEKIYGLKRKDITINLEKYDFNYCNEEIKSIRSAREIDITNLSNYEAFFRAKGTNKNAKKLRIKDIKRQVERSSKSKFDSYHIPTEQVNDFLNTVETDDVIKKELNAETHQQLLDILSELQAKLRNGQWKYFGAWKSTYLLNQAIDVFGNEVQRKTGKPKKPLKTGFLEYAKNRIEIEVAATELVRNIERPIKNPTEVIGSLGLNKGVLYFEIDVNIQDGTFTDSSLLCSSKVKKSTQKKFAKLIKKIAECVYDRDLFELIAKLNELDGIDDIKTIYELLVFKRYFTLDGRPYEPSSGEESMVMLHKELEEEKDVYILDEPERSLGNEYINDVIVPLLNDRARSGKRIFISTHDANIAVRTLPYCSVYRTHDAEGYETYVGNPYSNHLISTSDSSKLKDWKKVSMKTLEGGEEAFGERGKIYGNP
jgi:predicted ATPase